MTFRKFTPEEEAVFNLIIKQREQSDKDYFIYSISQGQKMLQDDSDSAATNYGIGQIEQRDIIRKLAKDGVIDADWAIGRYITNTKTSSNPWAVKKSYFDVMKLKFARHKNKYILDKYGVMAMLFEREDLVDWFFIRISFNEIKTIRENCITKYTCILSYSDKKNCFFVKCSNGKNYFISNTKLKPGLPPFEILRAALESPDNFVTRDDLKGKINIGKKSIATTVIDRNSVIRNELAQFVKLTSDSFKVIPEVELTAIELDALEKVCI